MEVNRNRAILGFVAALAIIVGGVYAANNAFACGSCPAHAQKANATETTAADAQNVKADGSCCPTNAKTASADSQCAEGAKTASAKGQCADHATMKTASADGQCADKANAKMASAKGQCADHAAMKTASADGQCAEHATAKMASAKGSCAENAKGQCMLDGKKTAELMNGEATLAKLAHCGVNINAANTETLAAKLADHGCGKYTAAQWATMIESAKKLDTKTTEAVMASAKSEKACTSDQCPMSMVAKDLAASDTKTN